MSNSGVVVVLYAAGIHEAIKSGDLDRMKAMAEEAEKHLEEYGAVREALEVLRGEIARCDK